jgi:hypothetical protein
MNKARWPKDKMFLCYPDLNPLLAMEQGNGTWEDFDPMWFEDQLLRGGVAPSWIDDDMGVIMQHAINQMKQHDPAAYRRWLRWHIAQVWKW